MKNCKIVCAAIMMGLIASDAMAQASNHTTTINLSAVVQETIQLGEVVLWASGAGTISGSNNNFNATFPTNGNAIESNAVSIVWLNSTVSTPHKLSVSSANGGMINPNTPPTNSNMKNRIPYSVAFFWGHSGSFLLDLETNPTIWSAEIESPPQSNEGLDLAVFVAPTTNLISGTYTDTLTATITPTP